MTERELFERALQGDRDAVAFCEGVFEVSQIWDNLVDRDVPVDRETINRAFWLCLAEIPANPFYRKHADILQPMMRVFIMDWLDSFALERGSDHDKNVAFVLRDSVSGLLVHCAGLVGGYEWMREVSPEIRRAIFGETVEQYKAGLG